MKRRTRPEVWAAVARRGSVGPYLVLAWRLCHDGTSRGDFTALLIIGGILLPFVLLSDWIAQGKPLPPGEDQS